MSLYTSLIAPTTNGSNIEIDANLINFKRRDGQGADLLKFELESDKVTITHAPDDLYNVGRWWYFVGNPNSDSKAAISGQNSRFRSDYQPGGVGGFYASCPDADGNGPSSVALNANQIIITRGSLNPVAGSVYSRLSADGDLQLKDTSGDSRFLRSGGNTIVKTGNKSFTFQASGNATCQGSWIDGSDQNFKEDIQNLDLQVSSTMFIDRIKQLRPVTFKRTGNTEVETGLLAQEVGTILPSATVAYEDVDIVDAEDGSIESRTTYTRYGIRYSVVTANLIAAMKQLITKVETLEAQVAALS